MIDEDHSGVDATSDALATLDVLSEDGAAQAIIRIIGEGNGRLFIFDDVSATNTKCL